MSVTHINEGKGVIRIMGEPGFSKLKRRQVPTMPTFLKGEIKMIKITVTQLQQMNACQSGIDWFMNQKKKTLKTLVPALLDDNHFDYARWLLSRLLTKEQNQLWAINSAELVLPIFEKNCPNDLRPRTAILMAKKYLKKECTIEELLRARKAAYTSASAAYAADDDASVYTAYAAYTAYTAAAAYTAYSAYTADNVAAYAASVTKKQIQSNICFFALKLLGEIT